MTERHSKAGVVIVGAGQGGAELSGTLRQLGYSGSVTLVGDEPYAPYGRPPLSKGFLAGEVTVESLYLRSAETYARQQIDCRFGIGVEDIDRDNRVLRLFDGTVLPYQRLVLAVGGRPRRLSLSGADHLNVHYVRTIDDILRLRGQFLPGKRLLIVGGGYIGLEAASIGIKRGLDVTLVEALPRVLARVAAPEVSAFYERAHGSRGVKILTGVGVHALKGDPLVNEVVLSDGTRMPVEILIVGIGIVPNTEIADASGLEVANGIVVDAATRTADPVIYAIGDCSSYENTFLNRRVRLESVPNAMEQARICAAAICGKPIPPSPVPWFWSDQYNLKLQMVGLSAGYDEIVIRGAPSEESFLIFYLKAGVIISADAVNRPQEFMLSKRLVAGRVRATPAALAAENQSLKALLPQ